MEGIGKYVLSLKNVCFYSPGSYKISIHVQSHESSISFKVSKENEIHEQETKSFVTETIEFTQSTTDGAQLNETEITVDIDKNVYPDPAYLHIDVLKLISSDDEPSNSNKNDYQKYCTREILLQPPKCIFQEDVVDNTGERSFNGNLNFFSLLEGGFVRVAAGWIKYALFFSRSEVEEEVREEAVNDVENTTALADETNVSSPEYNTPHLGTQVNDGRLSGEECEIVESSLSIPLKESHISVRESPTSVKDSKINVPAEESRVSLNIVPTEQDNIEVEPPKTALSLKSPEAPLAYSGFLSDLPHVNAIKYLLPKYHALEIRPHTEIVDPHIPIKEPSCNSRENRAYMFTPTPERLTVSPHTKENLDAHVVAVLDYQSKELDRYRGVIQRMGTDIMQLRNEISELHDSKNQLVRKLYYAGEGVSADGNNDNELIQLKRGLLAENEVKNELQQRIHNLQNQLIKKNETEASYMQLQQAHQLQQKVLLELQSKMVKYKLLQETLKNQELVIEKLEKQMNEKNVFGRYSSVPQAESTQNNEVKRKENKNDLKKKSVSFKSETSEFKNLEWNADVIDEKLRLLQRVEQAERTVSALEEQLYNNSRQWAKERSSMQRSMFNNNQYSPQKLLTSRSYEQNMNYLSYQPNGARYQNTLQFPPYTYQHPMNNSWNVP